MRMRHAIIRLILTALAFALALPAASQAASDPASATITVCQVDHLTVAGRVSLTGAAARKARGAILQMRFQALGLFGFPRAGVWRTVGKKTKASGQETFSGLGADNWIGVMSWRFKKGSRSVLAGDERSQPAKIGGAKGRANCTLAEGAKPADTTPPVIYVNGSDDQWHHAPGSLQVTAQDDFSGVQSLRYSVDGGPATPVANGGVVQIATEGAHTVVFQATDVAGNTATNTSPLKVDAAPPSKPVVTGPASVTASQNPTVTWSASSDSGSGMRGYYVSIKRSDGSLVVVQPVDATTTSLVSPATLDDNQTYTAVVTAVDNTADTPWTADSDPYTFTVDTHPDIKASPDDGTVLSGGAKNGNFSLALDRPAVTKSVPATLRNEDTGTAIPMTTSDCTNGCTTIVLDPQTDNNGLPEGRYTLTVKGLPANEPHVTFPDLVAHYSVPFLEGGSMQAKSNSTIGCVSGTATQAGPNFDASANGEKATLDFDWNADASGPWTVQARINNQPAGGNDTAGGSAAGSGHIHMGPFNIAQGALTFVLTVGCPTTQVTISNMLGARVP